MTPQKKTRSSGRPRLPETERRILAAALRSLAREGYNRMSLDAVALKAGVSKPTLYRRWSGKADLATAALRSFQLTEPPVCTGSTVGDLTGILKNFRKSLLRPNGMALIGTVLAEEQHTPELLDLFRNRILEPRRRMLRKVFKRARKKKELQPDANIDAAVNLLVGAFYARYLATSRVPPSWPAELVEIVWSGIRRTARNER